MSTTWTDDSQLTPFDPFSDPIPIPGPRPEVPPPEPAGGLYPFIGRDDEVPALDLDELPEMVVPRPITGDGLAAIREWVHTVTRHYDPVHDRAVVQYASWIGYHANLKTFRVEVTDQGLAAQLGISRTRLVGHHRRLREDGFLVKVPKRRRNERGTPYVLSWPAAL